jgi:hypothetical protein
MVTVSEALVEVAKSVHRQLLNETNALVAAHWPAIERVAGALTSRDLLSESELDALIAGIMPR